MSDSGGMSEPINAGKLIRNKFTQPLNMASHIAFGLNAGMSTTCKLIQFSYKLEHVTTLTPVNSLNVSGLL